MILLSLLLAAGATGTSFQDTAALDRAVSAFTGHSIGEQGGARAAIDARLRLATCPTVALSWRSAAQDAVVVTCGGPSWRLFVPVYSVAVAARPISPAVAAPVKPEFVVKRGDPVVIEAGSDSFSITREGVAMGDAAAGARVMIKVEDAKAPVQTVAVAGGRVTLPGWGE